MCPCDRCAVDMRASEAQVSRTAYAGLALCANCREVRNEEIWQQLLNGRPDPYQIEAAPSGYGLWSVTLKDREGRRAYGGGFGLPQALRNAESNAQAGRFADA